VDTSSASPKLTHEGALDGLRGVAVLAVLAYHGGVTWAQGGWFGVEAFFVLSGFLITSLLVAEWRASSTVRLGRFWARRARRLLPALFCLVAATAIQQAIVGVNGAVPDFRGDGISTLFYYANWHQLATGTGYFALTALPSPLLHTWSLAIEEQFYLVWPLLVLAILSLGRRRPQGEQSPGVPGPPVPGGSERTRLKVLFAVAALGSIASAVEMGVLFHRGSGLNRVYYGTDTRAQGLLAGAALAAALALSRSRRAVRADAGAGAAGDDPSWGLDEPAPRPAWRWWALQTCGLAGMGVLVAAVGLASWTSGWWYRGGFLGVDVAALAVIGSVVAHGSRPSVTRLALRSWPLRSTGVISYGLYLWHYPLFLWLTAANTGLAGTSLLGLRLAASFGAAIVSYFVVEQPIRERQVPPLVVRLLAPIGLSGALAPVVAAGNVAAAVPLLPQVPAGSVGTTTTVPVKWTGKGQSCRVQLPVPSLSPVYKTFHTCPPVRTMIIGDSVGQTISFQLDIHQERYGVLLDNSTLQGCGYIETGLVGAPPSSWANFNSPCYTGFATWKAAAAKFRPQVVLVEMGWWDSMDHLIDGQDMYLGETSFDTMLVRQMVALIDEMDTGGARVVLLSVPWMLPPPWPDGVEMPAALSYRHHLINALLQQAAAERPGKASYFDIGPYVTPAGRFEPDVGGSICRTSDGIHLYWGTNVFHVPQTYCGAALQAGLLPWIRLLVGKVKAR